MNESKQNTRKDQYNANRKALITLSKLVRPLVEEGEFPTVNETVKEQYFEKDPEIKEFRTFGQWKDEGYTIVKGSKAYTIWGQPRKVSQVPEGEEEPEEYKYWPLCYLFAITQVYKPEKKEKQPEPQKQGNTPKAESLESALMD